MSGRMAETMVTRVAYAGRRLDDVEALMFSAYNADPADFTAAVGGEGRASTLAHSMAATGPTREV